MTLKLYIDLMSQPSRALFILLKKSNCKFEKNLLDLRNGENLGDEFTKVNRFQKVPVINHNGFVLTESVAIIRYLSRENLIPESLYPKDFKLQARVDEFLEWQHIGLRVPCAYYFWIKFLIPLVTGTPTTPKKSEEYLRRMETALEDFDTKWLGRGADFVTGNTCTVADLWASCEIEQAKMAGYNPTEKYPNIKVWAQKVREHFNPFYDEGHVVVNKVIASNAKKQAKL